MLNLSSSYRTVSSRLTLQHLEGQLPDEAAAALALKDIPRQPILQKEQHMGHSETKLMLPIVE